MNPYDQAQVLAGVLRRSEEYAAYRRAKEKAFASEANVKLIRRYKKEQFRAQAAVMSGDGIAQETQEELRRMGNVVQFNRDVSEFLQAEYRVNQMMNEIFRILGQAVELDLSFMDADVE